MINTQRDLHHAALDVAKACVDGTSLEESIRMLLASYEMHKKLNVIEVDTSPCSDDIRITSAAMDEEQRVHSEIRELIYKEAENIVRQRTNGKILIEASDIRMAATKLIR